MKKITAIILSIIMCLSCFNFIVLSESKDILNVDFESSDWSKAFASTASMSISTNKALSGKQSIRLDGTRSIVEWKGTEITDAYVEYAFYDDMSNNRVIAKIENASNYIMVGFGVSGASGNYQALQGGVIKVLGKRNEGWHKITVVCKTDESIVYLDGEKCTSLFPVKPNRIVFGAPWDPDFVKSDGVYFDDIRIGTGEPAISTEGLSKAEAVQTEDPNTAPKKTEVSKSKTEFAKKQIIKESAFDNAVVLRLNSNDAIVNNTSAMVDSNNPQVMPVTIDDRTMVPVRFISEAIGADVTWDEDTQTIGISANSKKATMKMGSNKLVVDGNEIQMDVVPSSIGYRTFIPLRALAESVLGKKVFWDDRGLIIISDEITDVSNENLNTLLGSFKTIDENTEVLYVSNEGNDGNIGTIDNPLSTIEGAKNKIKELKKANKGKSGFVVYIRGGEYEAKNSIKFTSDDSGSADAPIRFIGYYPEKPLLTGGVSIPGSFFEPVSTEIKDRLKDSAKDKVKVVDLTKLGLKAEDISDLVYQGHGIKNLPSGTELFINNKAQINSRYPNNGFISIAGVIKNGKSYAPFSEGGTILYQDRENVSKTWKETNNIWINGYLGNSYADTTVKVVNIDPEKKELTTQYPGNYGFAVGQYFYFMNILEETDMESEYYIDRDNMKLYVYSSQISDDADIRLSLSDKPILDLDGVSFVSFENIEIGYGRGVGVNVNNSHDIAIEGSTIKCFGEKAIQAANEPDDLYDIAAAERGVYNFLIKSNDIFSIGKGAMLMSGGDRTNLISGNIVIQNNEIYEYSRLRADDGIKMYGVGNTMSYNKMYSAPKKAIQFQGNNMVVENNEFFDVCQNVNDMGAVYMGRDITMQGNVIRNNFFHDIVGMQGKNGVHAIYCDDFSNGITAYGNLIVRVQDPIMFNGGSNHNVYNNIIAYKTDGGKSWLNINDFSSTLKGSKGFPDGHMIAINLKRTPYDNEAWKKAYPYLIDIINSQPIKPTNSVIKDNAVIDHYPAKANASDNDIDSNYITNDDPMFVDPDNMDYNLKPESPIFKNIENFKPLPYDEMGLFKDKYRN